MMAPEILFGPTGQITWGQECARAVVIFIYGLVLVRIAGRRIFANWAALDIIVSIVIGSSLSRALTGNADLGGTLAAITLLMALHWLLARAAAVSPRLSHLLEGRPVWLSQAGQIETSVLVRHGVSEAALNQALRSAGVAEAASTRLIVLEPSGKISVLKS
jgi:uncharacterized membrane protein YcaP (DUF421 family)